jgi:hypothetical protein
MRLMPILAAFLVAWSIWLVIGPWLEPWLKLP